MKYDDFKIFKFSTISKNINRIRDSFSRIYKKIKNITSNIADSLSYILKDIFSIIHKNTKTIPGNIAEFLGYISKYIFYGINKSIKFIIYNFLKIYKLINLRRLDFKKAYKYIDIKRYDFYRINRKINLANYKYAPIYFVIFVIFMGFVYVVIPKFYSYDKSKIAKIVCNNQNVECLIKGKVYYSFYPTPRIKIKDLIINDLFEKKDTLATVKNVVIKLSIKNLLVKKNTNLKR